MRTIYVVLCGFLLLMVGSVVRAETVDINSATAEQLSATMKDIGKVKAEAIVKERETHGPFKSVDDLARVKGIKAATINKNRDRVTVGAAAAPAAPPAKGAVTGAAPAAPAHSPPK